MSCKPNNTLFVETVSQTAFIHHEPIEKNYNLTPSTLARIIFLISFSKQIHVMRNCGDCITIDKNSDNDI